MRGFALRECISVPKLTPGRRRKAVERMKPIAVARGLTEVANAIDRAIALEDRALALAVLWSRASGDHAMHEEGAQEVDGQLDRAYTGLYESLQLKVRAFTDHRVALAQSLLDTFYPEGPGPVVTLPYVDQHAHIGAVLAQLQEPVHQQAIAALNLEDWVQRIAEVNAVYGSLLTRPERLTHADVVAADKAGWSALLSVVARVLGAYPDDTEADIEGRRTLLQPIADQQEEMAQLRARRRGEGPPMAEKPEPLDEEVVPEPADTPEVDAA